LIVRRSVPTPVRIAGAALPSHSPALHPIQTTRPLISAPPDPEVLIRVTLASVPAKAVFGLKAAQFTQTQFP